MVPLLVSRTKANADHAGLSPLLDLLKESISSRLDLLSLFQNNNSLTATEHQEILDVQVDSQKTHSNMPRLLRLKVNQTTHTLELEPLVLHQLLKEKSFLHLKDP